MRVFLTGGTGLIGTRLIKRLIGRGDRPVVLTRRQAAAQQQFGTTCDIVEGDPGQAGSWMDKAAECDAVVNLAGESLFNHRWSPAFKKLMYDSRIKSTANVAQAQARKALKSDGLPKVFVSASAIGIYGPHGAEELDESSPAASDYLGQMCVDWENASKEVEKAGIRRTVVRIGVVLDKKGGALKQLLRPFWFGAGGPVASGRQYMSWIHHEDLTNLFLLALDRPQAVGPINGTAPNPVTNKEFGNTLGRAMSRPSFMWTPGFMLRLMLGEVANVVTQGQRVLPRRALELGYQFQYPNLDEALKQILASDD